MSATYPIPRHQWHQEFKENGVIRGEFLERRDRNDTIRHALLALPRPPKWTFLAAYASVTFSGPDGRFVIKATMDMKVFIERKLSKIEWKSEKESYRNADEVVARVAELLNQQR